MRLLLSGILVMLVIALHVWLIRVGPIPGDRWAAYRFSAPWTERPFVQHITAFYQALGLPAVAIAITSLAGLVLLVLRRFREILGLAIACTAVAVNGLLKLIWGPTPLWVATHHHGANFPSGHTTYATVVFGYLGLLGYRFRRPEVVLVALVLILGMGPARVISGAHLVSDAIAGYMLGTAWLLLAFVWLDSKWLRLLSGSRPTANADTTRRRAVSEHQPV